MSYTDKVAAPCKGMSKQNVRSAVQIDVTHNASCLALGLAGLDVECITTIKIEMLLRKLLPTVQQAIDICKSLPRKTVVKNMRDATKWNT